MAWLAKANWVAVPKNPEGADLDNFAADDKTWGGNVDAAGYNLSNLGVLTFHAAGYVSGKLRGELGALGQVAGNALIASTIGATSNNVDVLQTELTRITGGNAWGLASWRIRRTVDNTEIAALDFGNDVVDISVRGSRKARVDANGLWLVGSTAGLLGVRSANLTASLMFNTYNDGADKALVTGNRSAILELGNTGISFSLTPNAQTADAALDGLVTALAIDTAGRLIKTDYGTYADNAAAVAGGLTAGMHYRTAAGQVMVVY